MRRTGLMHGSGTAADGGIDVDARRLAGWWGVMEMCA